MTSEFSQVTFQNNSSNLLRIIVKQHNFFAGQIDLTKRIFYHVPRSNKNLFHLFGHPGLGINEEILLRNNFDIIKVKFNDEILTCPRRKWLQLGIKSPFCNASVDLQIILKLSEINMDVAEKYLAAPDLQIKLFDGVIQ